MKKKQLLLLAGIFSFSAYSQTNVTDFEDLSLPINSFWDGSDLSGQFASNSVVFQNKYDTSFGGYWAAGATYSSMTDDTTAGYGNLFSCIAGSGYNASSTYAVINPQMDSLIKIPNYGRLKGFWVNNSTYTYLSMRDGDAFAKKFGDTLGANGMNDGTNGADFLKLTVYGEYTDSVEFYLADFRGPANADYLIGDWTYVSLSGLNPSSKRLKFGLTSSDNGSYGMNTPGFFCIDNLEYETSLSLSSNELSAFFSVFPNPTTAQIKVIIDSELTNGLLTVTDIFGRQIMNGSKMDLSSFILDFSEQSNGVYFLTISQGNVTHTQRIVKQ